jgi:hypothetical protein
VGQSDRVGGAGLYRLLGVLVRGGDLLVSDETREPAAPQRPLGELLGELATYQERLAKRVGDHPCSVMFEFKEDPSPLIPKFEALGAVVLYGEHPNTVTFGFKEDPTPLFPQFEALGAQVIEESWHETLGEVERMPRWKYYPWRLLWRLGIKLDRPRGRLL